MEPDSVSPNGMTLTYCHKAPSCTETDLRNALYMVLCVLYEGKGNRTHIDPLIEK